MLHIQVLFVLNVRHQTYLRKDISRNEESERKRSSIILFFISFDLRRFCLISNDILKDNKKIDTAALIAKDKN